MRPGRPAAPAVPRPAVPGRVLAAVLALVLSLAVGGCTSMESSGGKGYVSADGGVAEVAPGERGEAVDLSGDTVGGGEAALSEMRGKPVVVPVWGAWCGPCRKEAPELARLAEEYGDRVGFLGVNIRDASRERAAAFERTFDLPYESVYSEDGRALLAFGQDLPPRAAPSLFVLDDQGRIASLILGPYPSPGTVGTLVDDELERSGEAAGEGSATRDG